jgi:hypothetical protein
MSNRSNFENWPGQSPEEKKRLKLYVYLFSGGLTNGMLMNSEAAIWYKQAQEQLAEDREDKPPKQPRRPNARNR